MDTQNTDATTTCRRCGTCCRKGGPAFHREDRHLIDGGIIPARDLYTIRKGEPAYENIHKQVVSVGTDIIKIKGKPGRWECLYFDAKTRECGIYHNRPLECRALACWDTDAIDAVHASPRLTRKELLSGVRGMWDLIEDHHNRCDYGEILALKERINTSPNTAPESRIREMVAFDRRIRKTLTENNVATEMMNFLFGRPLSETLPALGIETF